MVKKIDMILRNEWEKYDEKKMRKMKIIVTAIVFPFLWVLFFVLSYGIIESIYESAISASIILGIVIIIIVVKLKQMDQKKDGWYFSALQDKRMKREDVLEMIRNFLKNKGYIFQEEETHRTLTLWITYFTLPSTDFKIRLWFTTLNGVPVAEIGIGPESQINKELLNELRKALSEEFVKKYGTGKKPKSVGAG